jgi:hypothetical protein
MNITLELYDDQGYYDSEVTESSMWVMKVNGEPMPLTDNIMSLPTAHKIVGKLIDIEDLINDETR